MLIISYSNEHGIENVLGVVVRNLNPVYSWPKILGVHTKGFPIEVMLTFQFC